MNKISQKMIEISEKLASSGLGDRSKQFYIIAEELEEEDKIENFNKIRLSSISNNPSENKPEINAEELKQILAHQLTLYKKYKE